MSNDERDEWEKETIREEELIAKIKKKWKFFMSLDAPSTCNIGYRKCASCPYVYMCSNVTIPDEFKE